MQENKLDVRDLINVGLFTAIYCVTFFAVGMIGFIPITMIALPGLIGLVGGIPILLLVVKTQKFGALSICGIIVTLLMFFTGHPWPVVAIGLPVAVLGDLIMYFGKYKNWLLLAIGYLVFSQWYLGAFSPFYFMREAYFKSIEAGYGKDYVAVLENIISVKMIPVILILSVIGCFIGAYIAKAALKKHFSRAGII